MKHRICPNCGNTSPDATAGCPCGFMWNEGVEVPAPDIVRAQAGQRSAAQRVERTAQSKTEDTGVTPPEAAGAQERRSSAPLSDRPTEADNQEHPLLASSTPRRRATAPASFGTNSLSEPQQQPETRDHRDHPPSDQVFLGMGEEKMVVTENPVVTKPAAEEPAPAASPGRQARPNASLLMECPACDARISKRAARCPKCNTSPYQLCQICATTILANSASCSECGDPDPFNTEGLSDTHA